MIAKDIDHLFLGLSLDVTTDLKKLIIIVNHTCYPYESNRTLNHLPITMLGIQSEIGGK